ncbi:MAG: hypothetical protein E7582_05465 [Ruminococcaceae bacterium]|nr:hypothetical protein [Oscillospiraceae bacterium]
MLSLILAPSGYGKTYRIISEIKQLIEKKTDKKIYVIVPEQESVRMEAELLDVCGNIINSKVEVLNFSRLSNRVFREFGGMTYSYCDDPKKDLITAVTIEKLKSAAPSFSKSSEDTKYIKLLRSEMDSLRSKGIRPQDIEKVREKLLEEDRGGKALDTKLSDFALIFATYEKAIKENTTDANDDILRLAETLAEFDFFEDSYVYIDSFYDYTYPEYKVIEEIIKSSYKTTITFSLAEGDPDGIFRRTKRALDTIRKQAEKNLIEYDVTYLDENRRTENKALRTLSKALMTGSEITCDTSEGVKLTSCTSQWDECVYVAREIVKLVKNGASFKEIAVTASNIQTYGSMLENVFDSYGISYLPCTEKSILSMPVISLALSALEVINTGFFTTSMKTYLKSPYVNLTEEEAFALENYVTMWNVSKKQWYSKEPWKMHPKGYVEKFTDEDTQELNIVNEAREKVFSKLQVLTKGFSDMSTVHDKARSIIDFFDSINVYDKLLDFSESYVNEGREDLADGEISAWNGLLLALDLLVEGAGDIKVGRDRFIKYLKLVLSDMSFGKIPSSLDEVEIGDVEFVRNKNVKHMFFIGFNEGVFPAVDTTKSVFTESERKWLIENGIEIADTDEDKLKDQSFLYLLSILRPSKSINFVYHTASSESSKTHALPSYYSTLLKETLDVTTENFDVKSAPPVTKTELKKAILSLDFDKDSELYSLLLEENLDFARETMDLYNAVTNCLKPFELKGTENYFGDSFFLTQSRIEKYERCKFSYFVEYMLKLRVRKKAEFSSGEIGSYVHKILETVLRRLTEDGKDITTVEVKDVWEYTANALSDYISNVAPNVEEDSPKYKYLMENISAFVVYLVENIREEFSNSLFRPKFFEESLSNSEWVNTYEVQLKDGGKLRFYGIIDRVDTYIDDDGVEYIRIVDYKTKTGGKSFSLQDVINGMNLQMLIYLFAAIRTPSENKRAAAGIMYMPASKAELEISDFQKEDNLQKKEMDNSLKRRGMFIDDKRIIDAMELGEEKRFVDIKFDKKIGEYTSSSASTLVKMEEMGLIERYINSIFDDVAKDLKKGRIEASPLENGSSKSSNCSWCPYRPICRFEGEERKLIKADNPLEYMKEKLEE